MDEQILMGVYISLAILVFYSLAKFIARPRREFREEMDSIINSDKNKVKGKWDHH